jgi:hypothetical protein
MCDDNLLTGWFAHMQFMCLGYSVYEQEKARGRVNNEAGVQKLPYCEGIEVGQ